MREMQNRLTDARIRAIIAAAIAHGVDRYRGSGDASRPWTGATPIELARQPAFEIGALLEDVIQNHGKHPAWAEMKKVVDDLRRPSMYTADFYYLDREWLDKWQPERFAWAIRDTGTDLFIPGVGDSVAWAGAYEERWYWWDGTALEEATFETVRGCLGEYSAVLSRRWAAPHEVDEARRGSQSPTAS